MEKQVAIKQQFALQEREYAKNGETRKFASMGFILTDGLDTFYAEMTGNSARECGNLRKDCTYMGQFEMQVRSWETANHETAYATSVYINRLKPCLMEDES